MRLTHAFAYAHEPAHMCVSAEWSPTSKLTRKWETHTLKLNGILSLRAAHSPMIIVSDNDNVLRFEWLAIQQSFLQSLKCRAK